MANLGEEAAHKAGVNSLNKEVLATWQAHRSSYSKRIGSFGRGGHPMGLLAGEMGPISPSKRIGLLHDIGKSMTQDVEGPHAIVGTSSNARRTGGCCNGVASHHGEVPYVTSGASLSVLVSASRPGARSETMTTYLKRLSNLEKIGSSFEA